MPIPLLGDGRLDTKALAAAVTERTRLIIVCSPNNPTGPVVTHQELTSLLEAVPRDVLVVLDEAYVEYVRDEQAANGPASWPASQPLSSHTSSAARSR